MAAVFFTVAGVNHFVSPAFYQRIIPPGFPAPALLVAVSGFFEIVGGLGLLARRLRRAAGWGLIALLIAVFPANIYMAVRPERFLDLRVLGMQAEPRMFWARLPLQVVVGVWVWYVAREPRAAASA